MAFWLKRRSALVWFCGGALFMATLGASLAGAVGALFWTRQEQVSDAFADDTLAARKIVAGVAEGWGIPDFAAAAGPMPPLWNRPNTGDPRHCDIQIRVKYLRVGRDFQRIYGAVVHQEQRNGQHDADLQAQEAFRPMPRVALGALAQCMERSLLAGACTAWARHRLAQDRQVQAKVQAALLANAKDGDDQACLLLDWAKQSSGGQTLIGKLQ